MINIHNRKNISKFPLKLTVLAFITIPVFHHISAQADSSSWQGEWGAWEKPADVSYYKGASVSIHDCQADSTCSFSFNFKKSTNSKDSGSYGGCDWNGKFNILSSTSAVGTVTGAYYTGSCKFEFSMNPNNPTILQVSQPQGTNCHYFCNSDITYPETYHLRSHINYPDLGRGNHISDAKQACYADDSPTRKTWCEQPAFAQLEQKVESLLEKKYSITHADKDLSYDEQLQAIRDQLIQNCAKEHDVEPCIQQAYTQKIAELGHINQLATIKAAADYKALIAPSDANQASAVISKIEGVYKYRFQNGNSQGDTYPSEDILEIVKVANDAIYFKEKLDCANGCGCLVYGIAKYKQSGLFLFAENPETPEKECINEQCTSNEGCKCVLYVDKKECLLKIIPDKKGIKIVENENCRYYCGIRGILNNDSFTYDKRRKIRYMKILTNSQEYKSSVTKLNKGQ